VLNRSEVNFSSHLRVAGFRKFCSHVKETFDLVRTGGTNRTVFSERKKMFWAFFVNVFDERAGLVYSGSSK